MNDAKTRKWKILLNVLKICSTILEIDFPSFLSLSFPPFVGKAGNNSIARHVTGSLQKVTEFFSVCSRNISRLCGQLKKEKK